MNLWAKDSSTCGGQFSLSRNSKNPATTCRGARQLIVCNRAGPPRTTMTNPAEAIRPNQKPSQKCNCPWQVWTEETENGWVVTYPPDSSLKEARDSGSHDCLVHNHPLITTQAGAMNDPSLRGIPNELHVYADHLRKGGLSPTRIFKALVRECNDLKIEVTFTVTDVRNSYGSTAGDRILDCTNLADYLKQRQMQDQSLDYSISLDSHDGNLDRVFFVMKEGKQIWSRSQSAVLMYDTKHGTNRYGLKLGCFVTLDYNGKTRVIAASFVSSEDEASFMWAFKKFTESFQSPPVVVFTDSDRAMALAVKNVWANTIHLLCTFHIWKNYWEHIRPLFPGAKNDCSLINHRDANSPLRPVPQPQQPARLRREPVSVKGKK